ncbi:MAG: hypothetical protein IPH20_10900 [Bacteroidales bacterium]|nr:hypothetical protein [Bacteroidales bacterium]
MAHSFPMLNGVQMATYLDESVNCNVVGWQGTNAGGKLKSTGTSLWRDPNAGATNQSGFTALPGGNCCPTCGSDMLGFTACFTSSSDYTTGTIRLYYLDNDSQQINMDFLWHELRLFCTLCEGLTFSVYSP